MRSAGSSSSGRAFLLTVLGFALLHFLVLNALAGAAYVLSHLPTSVLPLDPFLLFLERVHRVLWFPRDLLRWLWPGERTPGVLNWLLLVLHSLCWGGFLIGLRNVWRKLSRPG